MEKINLKIYIYATAAAEKLVIVLLKTNKLPNYAINYSAWSTAPFSICALLSFNVVFNTVQVHYKQLMLHNSYCGPDFKHKTVHNNVQCMLRPSRYTWDIQQHVVKHMASLTWKGLVELQRFGWRDIKTEIAICPRLSSVSSLPRSHSAESCWRSPWWGSLLPSSLWREMRNHKTLIQHLKNVWCS